MPAAIALAIRALIQMAVTLGLINLADKFVFPLINKGIVELMKIAGISEEDAKDIVANSLLEYAGQVGVGVLVLRAKIPLKIADRLGFTTKGWAKRRLKPKAAAKASEKLGLSMKILGAVVIWNVLTDWVWIGNSLGFLPEAGQKDIQKRALSILNLINSARNVVYSAEKKKRSLSQQETVLIKQIADTADNEINDLRKAYSEKFFLFGRGDVEKQMVDSTIALQLELASLRQIAGLVPRADIVVEKTEAVVKVVIDGDTLKLDNGETVRFLGIDAPESSTPEGEEPKKYLKERLEGKSVRVESDPNHLKDIYGRRLGVIYLDNVNINIEMLQKGYASFYEYEQNALVFKKVWQAAAKGAAAVAPAVKVRVFTGVISAGTLGETVDYTPRIADLIGTIEELQNAAATNLVEYIKTLPGRISYQAKIVPSIVTASGFRQRGTAQQIQVGVKKDGTPKYKNVVNKFAIVNVKIKNQKGTLSNLAQIILGPVDALKLLLTPQDIDKIQASLAKDLATSKISEIQSIITTQPVTITPPAAITVTPTSTQAQQIAQIQELQKQIAVAQAKIAVAVPVSNNPNRCLAATIRGYFGTNSPRYPTIAERAKLYESWGLGPAAYYVGTAEQNNKFLAEIKRRSGC